MALVLNFGRLPLAQLRAIDSASEVVAHSLAAWRAEGRRAMEELMSDELMRGAAPQDEFTHYPSDDVRDAATGAQYFYHCHRGAVEHGHFHVFLRRAGMPCGVRPRRWPRSVEWPSGRAAIAHLIAISMAPDGRPQALFCTNRWVTDETWYPARDVIRMLDYFQTSADTRAGRWLAAMLVLFRPQIEFLLHHRDQVIDAARRVRRGADVLENRHLEITGMLAIDVETQRRAAAAALARRTAPLQSQRQRQPTADPMARATAAAG